MSTPRPLRECVTAAQVAEHYMTRFDALHPARPERSATKRPDGSSIRDPQAIGATLAWRRWNDSFVQRSIQAVRDHDRRASIAAQLGRPSPRWSGGAKPATISIGDSTYEVGPGGCARRVTAPSHVPGGPRAVAPPAVVTTAQRHRKSEAVKRRVRAATADHTLRKLAARGAAARAARTANAQHTAMRQYLLTGEY